MLDAMKYVNSKGETITFGVGIYVNYNDIRDYEWEYVSKSNRIAGFRKSIAKKSIPLVIARESREKMIAARDELYQVIERDVINNIPGKLYIGDFYLECFLHGSKNSGYLAGRDMQTTLTLVTDRNVWINERKYNFTPKNGQQSEETTETYMDYPYDYEYDYSATVLAYLIENQGIIGADFLMLIYGPCINPSVAIAGHPYTVNCELKSGEYLVIDSLMRKIYKVLVNGEQVNQFHLRDREYGIFLQIPEGVSTVTWDGSFGFEMTVFEGRSEPRWI